MKFDKSKYTPQKIKQIVKNPLMITAVIIAGLFGTGLMAGIYVFNKVHIETAYEEYVPKEVHTEKREAQQLETQVISQQENKKTVLSDKNIVVFGVDKEEARTDTILVVHFDSRNSKICIVSIPRDTKVTWSESQIEEAEKLGRPYQYEGKITDMSSLGGIDNLRHFTVRSIEEMLDIKVDNYAVVNTSMIREIVDQLGGIQVNVPRKMKYTDNWQGLVIDLEPGLQILNGEQAEGLLRWRHNEDYSEQYALGDLGRIETQQLFLKAFMHKVLNDLSVNNILHIISSVYSNVKTDVNFRQIMDYLGYLDYISEDHIVLKTLPGESVEEDLWYYIIDEDEILDFVDENFYGTAQVNPTEIDEFEESALLETVDAS